MPSAGRGWIIGPERGDEGADVFSANAFTSIALMSGDRTKAGDWKLQLLVTARF
jgi:hypothetical protein